jgi:spore coat polysaccharide biosynthesis protein SpsF
MIIAIVQARVSSARLPAKVLEDISGKPLIEHVLRRVMASKRIDRVVVATTDTPADDTLVETVGTRVGCPVFRGSESDVLDRFYRCALEHGADVVVRITADDPLKDPEIIDRAVGLLVADPALDYCSNTLLPTFPEGLDVEVFRVDALARAAREATRGSDREHVTPYIWRHPDVFSIRNFEHEEDLSHWRWTVDRPRDLAFVRCVYDALYRGDALFSYRDVIAFVRSHPDVLRINEEIARSEGYTASLERDGEMESDDV